MDMQVKPRADAPRILVFATARWQLAARIAINFLERGCIVSVLAPRGHPAECIEGLAAFHRFLPLAPRVTTRRALRVAGADLVVPCDDAAVLALDDLQRHQRQRNSGADRWLPLLERSVGNLEACAFAGSRKDFMTLARDLGLRTPTVIEANSAADILEWMAREQRPVVLKTDHSFGGQGVAVVRDAEEAARTWVRLESRPGLWRTAIRSLLERDSMPLGRWWREQTAPVSAQAMIEGHAANRAVACWRGEVLAGVSVEVLRQQHATSTSFQLHLVKHRNGRNCTAVGASSGSVGVRRLRLHDRGSDRSGLSDRDECPGHAGMPPPRFRRGGDDGGLVVPIARRAPPADGIALGSGVDRVVPRRVPE